MKRALFIAALIVLPGGAVVGAGWLVYRWAVRRAARREVNATLVQLGVPRPRKDVHA